MSFHVHSFRADAPAESDGTYLPPQVRELAWREREIASIVYRLGYATAKDVEAELEKPLTNAALRIMLVRLVSKGILDRRHGKRGAGCADLFIAALSVDDARRRALSKIAEDFFSGSLSQLKSYVESMPQQSA